MWNNNHKKETSPNYPTPDAEKFWMMPFFSTIFPKQKYWGWQKPSSFGWYPAAAHLGSWSVWRTPWSVQSKIGPRFQNQIFEYLDQALELVMLSWYQNQCGGYLNIGTWLLNLTMVNRHWWCHPYPDILIILTPNLVWQIFWYSEYASSVNHGDVMSSSQDPTLT